MSAPAAKDPTLRTSDEVVRALAEKYAPPEFAFFEQVRNSTGFRRTVRTADAMAMSLWPSRGLLLHGFEVKVTRTDWLRELANPAKAEELAAYCDRWWIVVGDPKVVQEGELPPTWGLIAPAAGKLKVKREAPPLTPVPFDRIFFASLMRCAHEVRVNPRAMQAEYQRGFNRGKEHGSMELERTTRNLEELRKKVQGFEQASGINLSGYTWDHGKIGEAVRLVLKGQHVRAKEDLELARDSLRRAAAHIDQELANLAGPA